MSFERKINELYNQIAQKINDMIPTDWEHFAFNGEVKNKEGGVFFFFKSVDNEEYIYSHHIPNLYNINKRTAPIIESCMNCLI